MQKHIESSHRGRRVLMPYMFTPKRHRNIRNGVCIAVPLNAAYALRHGHFAGLVAGDDEERRARF
jgi:hypothetical protein